MSTTSTVLLAGTGPMAVAYAKVLQAQRRPFIVVGRGEQSAGRFAEETGVTPITGGLAAWLHKQTACPTKAIVAVSEDQIGKATLLLLRAGCKKILVEKPGGFNGAEIKRVAHEAKRRKSAVFVGYNRRFYASVKKAQEIIKADGGVTSFNFEFTEWGHVIAPLAKAPGVKAMWFLHNSTHVIDLAFFLGGWPKTLTAFKAGSLPWHPKAAIFAGSGKTKNGALFSYQANWAAPGRWSVEILTKKHRLIFRPMEKLHIQNIGSVQIEEVPIDDQYDTQFKPGIYEQVAHFLVNRTAGMCTIGEQLQHLTVYRRIGHT